MNQPPEWYRTLRDTESRPHDEPLDLALSVLAHPRSRDDVVLVGRRYVRVPKHQSYRLYPDSGLDRERGPRVPALGHRRPGGTGAPAGRPDAARHGVGRQVAEPPRAALAQGAQPPHREARQPARPGAALGLRRHHDLLAMDHLPTAPYAHLARAQVDVRPAQAARLAAPEAERHRADGHGLALVAPQGAQVACRARRVEHPGPVRRLARELHAGGGWVVHPHAQAADCPADDLPQCLVGLLGGAGKLEAVDPRLYVLRRDRVELDARPARQHVQLQGAAVALQRGGPQALALVCHVLGGGIGK